MDAQIVALERELLRLRRTLKNDEQGLERTLDDMEHLKNSLSGSTDNLAVQRAENDHARCTLPACNDFSDVVTDYVTNASDFSQLQYSCRRSLWCTLQECSCLKERKTSSGWAAGSQCKARGPGQEHAAEHS